MDRILCKKGEFKKFVEQVENKLDRNSDELGKLINVSGRTIRDWKREKFTPTQEAMITLSKLSSIPLPSYKVLAQYWYVHKGASKGGKKRYELYGPVGTRDDRVKGGRLSWLKRKNNPSLWNIWRKYRAVIAKPEESVDLAEFIGIILGDGGLTRYQCTVYLNSETEKKYADYVSKLIKLLFNLSPTIYKSRIDKVLRVSISSVDLIEYLKSKGIQLGNKVRLQLGVPDWIWSNSKYTKACIRGLMDTDGCFVIHKYKVNKKEYYYPKISFSNRSLPILDFVYQGLKNHGFTAKKVLNKQVWLYNQNEVKKYLEEIGTKNYKQSILKILEGGPDGKAQVC